MVRKHVSLITFAVAGLLATHAAYADEYADVDKLFGAGQLTEAVQRADQFLASNPRDARMRFLKGLMLSEQGRTAEATAVFVKLTEDFPDLPEPYNNLAVIYSKQGQYDQARRSLEAAIRTNPSYATAYENLGDVYAKLASQAYAKALQMDGANNAKVIPKLAMIRDLFSPQATSFAAAAPKPGASIAAKPAAAPPVVAVASKPPLAVVAAAPAVAHAPALKPAPPQVPPAPSSPPVQASAAASPTPAPAVQATQSTDTLDAQASVQAWADAWSRKDVNAYFASYTKDFGGGKSRKAWEEERRARITGKNHISVGLSDFVVKVSGDKAVVQFRQAYSADALKVSSRKTLQLVRVAGKWLIQKESTGT